MSANSRSINFICSLALVTIFAHLPRTLSAQGYVYKQAALTTGTQPVALATADFNADGMMDVATANQTDGTVSVILGQPNGIFSAKVDYVVGTSPVAIVAKDLNGDGIADLAVLNGKSDTVSILLGKSDGAFENQVSYPTGRQPVAMIATDLNGDKTLDLVVANQGDGSITALLGNGDGTFQSQATVGAVSNPIFISDADINSDGKTDIVAATSDGRIVRFLNNGSAFTSSSITIGTSIGGLAIGDFNGDGFADIAATVPSAGELLILLGDGKGNFKTTYIPITGSPATLEVGDFNGDGKLDLVAGSGYGSPSTLLVLLGVGDGTFKPPSYLGFPGASPAMAIADFNNDGYAGITATDTQNNRVLINLGNGDGSLGAVSMLPLPAAAGIGGSAVADFNGDGKLDVALTQFNQTSGITGFISVLPGKGDGTFGAAVATQVPDIAISKMVTGDFNGDGKQDIATAFVPATGAISVVLGNGDGTFGSAIPNPAALNGTKQYMIAGNFNNDNKTDLSLISLDSSNTFSSLNVLLGNGDGTFTTKRVQNLTGIATGLTSGDFNHDGNMDLAVLDPQGAVNPDVLVFLGHGDGTFGSPVSYSTSTLFANDIATADFNGDGKADVAVGTEQGIYFFAGNGDGSFQAPIRTATPQSVNSLFVGDYDGDGKLDLFLVGPGALFLGKGDGTFRQSVPLQPTFGLSVIFAASGDFNGDGVFDVLQFSRPSSSFQSPPTASFWRSTPTAILSASQVSFSAQEVGSVGRPSPLTFENAGNAPLLISNIVASNGFSQTDNCPNSLPIEQSCDLDVVFSPTTGGRNDGTITVHDNDVPGTQIVRLNGNAVSSGMVSFAPATLTFPPQPAGSTSEAQAAKVTNSGSSELQIYSISASSPFAETNTCGSSLAPGDSCSVSITFTPNGAGNAASNLIFTDTADGAHQTIHLAGTGTAFTISSQSSKLSISSAGTSASDTIQVTPLSGFAGTINLTCLIAPAGAGTTAAQPSCSLNPASGQIIGASAFSSTLTITTTTPVSAVRTVDILRQQSAEVFAAFFIIGGLFVPRRKRCAFLMMLSATSIVLAVGACGGSGTGKLPSNPGTRSASYTVTVTATGSSVTSSTTISLSVQ